MSAVPSVGATAPPPLAPSLRHPLAIVAGVLGLVVAATAVRMLLNAWLGSASPLLTYMFAIALAAAWWGLLPAALATGLSTAAVSWLFLVPVGSFAVMAPAQRVSLALFGLLGLTLGLLGERLRRSRRRALEHSAELRAALVAADDNARLLREALAARDHSIHELEATDRRLRQAVEEFESLMRLAPVGIVVAHDARGAEIRGNPYAERLLGAPAGACLARLAEERRQAGYRVRHGDATLAPQDMPLQRAARTGQPVSDALHELELPGDERRSILVSAVPLLDPAGVARGALATMLDVTALRTAQSQLAARQAQLRTLFESMSEGYAIVEAPVGSRDPGDWRLVEANAAFARLAALPDAVGRRLQDASPGREHPWLECCAQVLADGAPVAAEVCDPALGHRWFAIDACALGAARVAVLLRDVTERKRADQDAAFLLFLSEQMRRSAADPDALVTTVLQSLRTHLDADRARLTEVDTDARRSRVVREVTRPGLQQAEVDQPLQPIDTPALRRLASGLPLVVDDAQQDPDAAVLVRLRSGTRAFIAAPLLRAGRWVASLALAVARPRAWTAREVQLVETAGERLWAALEIARAGASLRESEQRFRLMADGLPMLVWMHDADGGLHFVNREYCRFFGVTLGQVLGAGWRPLLHPDDGPRYVEEFLRCLRERRAFHAQVRVRDARGDWRWVESHGQPRFLPDGSLLGFVGASVDVTERRQLEADRDFLLALGDALQHCRSRAAIADTASQRLGECLGVDRCGVVELDPGGGPPVVLREFLAGREPTLCGPRPMRDSRLAFEAELRAGTTMVVADVAEDSRAAAHGLLLARLGIRALVVVPLRRGGELVATLGLWQAAPRAWTAREVDLVRSVGERLWPALETAQAMEATAALAADRERLLDAERAARGEVEAANRLKDEFLATISHELRTPLANIVSWTYVAQQSLGRDADTVRRGLGIIASNARAQSNLISDLLDMSRSVEGKLRLDCAPLALAGFVAECVESHAPAAASASLALEFRSRLDPAAQVQGDAKRLRQVLGNLLTNAIKFTPAGGRVLVEVGPAGSDYEIAVRDDGEGIDPALLPQLFERFRQGDSSASRQHGGLGIGLSLVRQLVELHGGRVSAHSDGRGRGATFRVLLPAVTVAARPDAAAIAIDTAAATVDATRAAPDRPAPAIHRTSTSDNADTEAAAASTAAAASRAAARLGAATISTGAAVAGEPPVADEEGCRGLRILAVEDEASIREFMQRTLEERGASVRAVSSATEALHLLQAGDAGGFDVLVSDIGLPELDGYRMMRRIRGELQIDPRRLPAIAVTAFSRDEDRARSLDAGFQAHLAKPYSVVQLVRLIAQQVRSAEQSRCAMQPIQPAAPQPAGH